MSYSMIPDLLLYGLLNIHSMRQHGLFIPQVKDTAHTCKQTPELTHLCLNTIVPKKTYYVWFKIMYSFHADIASDFCSTSVTCWAKIPGILNENGKSKQGGHTQVKVKFPVCNFPPVFLSTKTPPHYSHPFLPFTIY